MPCVKKARAAPYRVSSTMISFKNISRNQLLALFVFGAICYNSYLHFSSPAYRHYDKLGDSLRKDYDEFTSRVSSQIIPALYFCVTNSSALVSSSSLPPAPDYTPFSTPGIGDSLGIIDGRYFSCQGVCGFSWDGRAFCVGDDFFGFPILGVSPTIVTTSQGVFYLRRPPYYSEEKQPKKDSHD